MDSEKYSLKIENSARSFQVDNLTMNGTNYVSDTRVDTTGWPEIFKLTVTSNGNTSVIENARLIQQEQYSWDNNRFYLAFDEVSAQEIENAKLRAKIEYLALASDIDMEE